MTSRRGSGEGAVYRRADGLWVAAVDLPRGPDGRRRRRVVKARTKREVLDRLDQTRREATEGLVPDRSTTVGAYLTWWFGNACGHLKPTTMSSYRWLSTQYIVPRLGPVRLAQLTPAHVRTMLGKGSRPAGYSANTRRLARLPSSVEHWTWPSETAPSPATSRRWRMGLRWPAPASTTRWTRLKQPACYWLPG